MTVTIILCLISLIGALICLYFGIQKLARADETLEHAKSLEVHISKSWPSVGATPAAYKLMYSTCGAISVDAVYRANDGHTLWTTIKEFPCNPDDADDMAFAIRKAEELIDKLKEK